MTKWDKESFNLRKDHVWKSKPGYKIFVADRGAVRFDIPADWIVDPGSDSIKFHDRPVPDDDCLLQVSIMRLATGIDWSAFPLSEMIEVVVTGDERGLGPLGRITHEVRRDLELAWGEASFIDPVERREARSRTCLARGSGIQPLITMDFWPEHTDRFGPVWDEVLRTLTVGHRVDISGRPVR